MHPGTRILLYALSALAVPGLNHFQLAITGGLLLIVCLGRYRQVRGLLGRARWLFLLLVLMYAYSLPGEALAPALAAWSPTREGVMQGLLQAGRLVVLLLLLEVLVLRLSADALLAGIYGVLRPLSPLGLEPARAALRLALTMQAMQQPQGWEGVRHLLAGRLPEDSGPGESTIAVKPFRATDWAALSVGLLLLGLWLIA